MEGQTTAASNSGISTGSASSGLPIGTASSNSATTDSGAGGATSNGTSAGVGATSGGGAGGATSSSTASVSSTTGGGTGGGTTGTWHAATASAVTDALLTAEYDNWKQLHWQACDDGSSVVVKDGSVVSEGIAYGMLLAANFDDRAVFDGLWQYYSDHLDANGLMNWATSLCEAPGNNNANAATDAELDATMALLQAQAAWPDGNYLSAAEALAQRVLDHETDTCDAALVLLPGDAWGGCNDSDTRINPSYFAPGYYRMFANSFPTQAEQWNQLLESSYGLYASYQAISPLVPDWDNYPYGDEAGVNNYYYDACRTPWRVAVDYAWSGEPRAATFLEKVASWVDDNGGIGSPGGRDNNSAFNGAFALSGATDQAKLDTYVSAWLDSGGDDTPYFQGTLRVLYLLVAGGRFASPS